MGKVRRHTAEQIVNALRQIEVGVANGKPIPAASREGGSPSRPTNARNSAARWTGETSEGVGAGNAKLKRVELVANLSLENLVLKKIVEGNF